MGHVRRVPKRQSRKMTNVDPPTTKSERERSPETIERANAVGGRIRAAMARKGWVDADGKPDVKRLMEAVGTRRWQTAQYWVEGEESPSEKYAALIARALGVTLEELMGLPPPPSPAGWDEFCATELGRSMTGIERASLPLMPWPHGEPDAAAWAELLLLVRRRRP